METLHNGWGKNLYALIDRVRKFPNAEVRDSSFKVIQRNAFFAYPENILLGMLSDDENVRRLAVNKIFSVRGKL